MGAISRSETMKVAEFDHRRRESEGRTETFPQLLLAESFSHVNRKNWPLASSSHLVTESVSKQDQVPFDCGSPPTFIVQST